MISAQIAKSHCLFCCTAEETVAAMASAWPAHAYHGSAETSTVKPYRFWCSLVRKCGLLLVLSGANYRLEKTITMCVKKS